MSTQKNKDKNPVYAPPPTLFTSEHFRNFNENEFIENLTYRLLNETKKTDGRTYADFCHAFEQLFELSLKELNKLKADENENSEKLIAETVETEKMHAEKLRNLTEEVDPVTEKLKFLEDDINRVGNATLQIGNNLEALDNQKKRAIEADKLIRYINEFNRYDPTEFAELILPIESEARTHNNQLKFKIFTKKSKKNAANKVKMLNLIIKDLSKVPNCTKAVENIKTYSDHLLSILSDQYIKTVKLLDVDRGQAIEKLKRRSKVMFNWNNGERCLELYVEERFKSFLKSQGKSQERDDNAEFSQESDAEAPEEYDLDETERLGPRPPKKVEKKKFVEDDDDDDDEDEEESAAKKKKKKSKEEIPQESRDPKEALKEVVRNEEQFHDFLGAVEDSITREYAAMEQIFPLSAPDALRSFLSKIINEVIRYIVDYLVMEPKGILSESGADLLDQYLKNLQHIYKACLTFCKKLLASKLPINETILMPTMESIFTERKKRYIDLEFKHTTAICKLFVDQLEYEEIQAMGPQNKGKEKELLGKLSNYLTGDLGKDIPTLLNPKTIASQMNLISETTQSVLDGMLGKDKMPIIEIEPLKLDFVVNLIHENADALDRCLDLTEKDKLETHMYKLLRVIFIIIGKYVNRAYETALVSQSNWKPYQKTAPPTQFFRVIQLSSSILHNLERHLELKVMPVLTNSIQIRLDCVRLRDDLFVPVESKVAKGLEVNLNMILEHLRYILEYDQKSADYNRREQDFHLDNEATAACVKVCSALKSQMRTINQTLYARNREFYLSELGSGFYKLLLKCLGKMVVSTIGAIRLMRDLKEYQKQMQECQIPSVDQMFEKLRETVNLFIVSPENLENVLIELQRTTTKEDLWKFVQMREDFKRTNLKLLPFFDSLKLKK